METMDLYSEIGQVLTQSESIQVLSALRQDPLVWQSLQQPDLFRVALLAAGSQVQCWSPGQLALFSIAEIKPETLRAEPMVPLGHVLQEKALRVYQATQRSGNAPTTLGEAGLLALALRERRRLTGTWSGLLQEILPRQAQAAAMFAVWRTALACLYAIIPDPLEMLRALMPKVLFRFPLDWLVISQLSQPLTEGEHADSLTQVLKNLPVSFQLGALRSLSLHGGENMAASIADRLLVGHPEFSNLPMNNQANELDLSGLSSRALSLHQLGTYYHLAGDRDQALSLYAAAETTLEQWLAGLYLQRINLRGGENEDEAGVMMGCGQLSSLASAAGWLKNE
ncbi:MAG: hypothetical protein IH586_17560, partial [Anaerolineaceae bacterium]|nr:hypothetical protein [Anaerolineaceae bacterium]